MSTFSVMAKDFEPTWRKMVPFLNCGKLGKNLSWFHDKKEWALYETAQKAVYVFICNLCDKGLFDVGLNTKINALDAVEASESDIGCIYYKPKIDEGIQQLLEDLGSAPESTIHCPNCQCQPFKVTPTNTQRQIVEGRISLIYATAQSFMEKDIGKGWIVGAKLLGSYL